MNGFIGSRCCTFVQTDILIFLPFVQVYHDYSLSINTDKLEPKLPLLCSSRSACRLLQLSVAYNALGPQGVVNLVMALPCESLHHLNVTSSMDDKASYSAIQSLLKFMETSGCVLSDLLLGDCEISDNDLQLLLKATHMFSGLHHLDLSCNNIGSDGISILSRLLKDSTLSVLILAGNGSIGSTGTESLLIAAKESRNLQKLNLSACGIKSPLPVTFFDALKNVASQIIKEGLLKELDLSHNCLSVEDKARLAEEWDSSTGKSSVCLENTLCVFTKKM